MRRVIVPASVEDLSRQLAAAQERIAGVDLRALKSIVEHTPEDMTATVQAGLTLDELQRALRQHGQWVPLDPPGAESLGIGDLLAHDLSGPRRLGYGTVREYVIGMRVALSGGEVIRNGGKVVKNVAGYDLCRLFIGAKHTLGIIVEATFKLRPVPEAEAFMQLRCASLRDAEELAERAAEIETVILDLHNINGELTLVLGVAGTREDVAAQIERARVIGFQENGNIEYNVALKEKASVLPSEIFRLIEQLRGERFIARLGNGIVYYEGPALTVDGAAVARELMRRVKEAYDPKQVLPEYF